MRYKKLKYEIRNLRPKHHRLASKYRPPLPPDVFTPQRYQVIAYVFFALMMLIGAIPGEAQALSDAVGDKLLHVIAYSFLTCMLFGSLRGTIVSRASRTMMMIGLLGGIDETIQSVMPYRNANFVDLAFDMLAGGLTLTVLILLNINRHRLYQSSANHRTPRSAEGSN